jgi:hypothetical protein
MQFSKASRGTAYNDPISPLYSAIISLVPTDITNPPSITRYLSIKDWYSMHYFSVCSGYYIPSGLNTSLLTSSTTNVICVRQWSGYNFSLQDTIYSNI